MPKPQRFSPVEALPLRSQKIVPPSLLANSGVIIDYKAMLIRLLCGTLNIYCAIQKTDFEQRIDYSHLTYAKNKSISSLTIRKSLSDTTKLLSLSRINRYLKISQANNLKFFKELFLEYCGYFFYSKEKNYVNAFLHLYRILESISLCFPLLWAAKSRDYENSFVKLRNYFTNPNIGELGFFHLFLDDVMDNNIKTTPIALNINSIYPDWQTRYFQTLTGNSSIILIDPASILSQSPYGQIVVSVECLTDLAINIRNRYFHFLTGKGNNLCFEDIPDPNEFFTIVNEPIANWLSIIFFELIIHEMDLLGI